MKLDRSARWFIAARAVAEWAVLGTDSEYNSVHHLFSSNQFLAEENQTSPLPHDMYNQTELDVARPVLADVSERSLRELRDSLSASVRPPAAASPRLGRLTGGCRFWWPEVRIYHSLKHRLSVSEMYIGIRFKTNRKTSEIRPRTSNNNSKGHLSSYTSMLLYLGIKIIKEVRYLWL